MSTLDPLERLRQIRLVAASGLAFGHGATPQSLPQMLEQRDACLRDILALCDADLELSADQAAQAVGRVVETVRERLRRDLEAFEK